MLTTTMMGGVALIAMAAVPVAAVVAMPTTAVAQDFSSGSLEGVVRDASGSPVSGAAVSVRSNEQGVTRSLTTDTAGRFRVPLIPIGAYTVTITSPGYAPISQSAAVGLGGASGYEFSLNAESADGATNLDDIVVTAARQTLAFNETTAGLVVNLEELVKTVPLGRDITSVVLLAPSTIQGDSTFGNLPAIGGSSVAENAFYVNGLNITNFDNYIGASTVPFDFYRSVEVKTGGYPAEFGRATGGIVNAVTKSGSNDFTFALRGNYSPDSLRTQSRDTYQARNELDERDNYSFTVEAGGPIIRDRLFIFGLAQFQETENFDASITGRTATLQRQDDPFYGVKVDGYITDDHRVELTYFDTTRETENFTTSFDPATDAAGTYPELPTINELGGESYVLRYTGQFTDWFTLSAAYGRNEDRDNGIPARTDIPFVQDARAAGRRTNPRPLFRASPNQPAATVNVAQTSRTFYRADADFYFSFFGDHHVRAGYELEETELDKSAFRTGQFGANLVYRRAVPGTLQAIGGNLRPGQEYVEFSTFRSGGSFTGENEAFYIQDSWDATEQLTLSLGVRLDKFALNNAAGEEFIGFDGELGPRLGFTFDPGNDNRSRVYGSYGRYYLPVASNTAFRGAANELFFSQFYLLNGYTPVAPGTFTGNTENADGAAILAQRPYSADGIPLQLGAQIVNWRGAVACPAGAGGPAPVGSLGCRVTGDGTVKDSSSFAAKNLESTALDEWRLGYERRLGDLWTVGAEFTYRDLIRNAEDVAIDAAVLALCNRERIVGCGNIYTGFHQYVLVNPGAASEILLLDPLPGETTRRTVNFSAADLNYPEAKREYTSLALTFERAFDGIWALQGSWTISKSEGNTEGYVKSDNGQTDAGITQDFDQPGLTDGAEGLLPNHRLHSIKLFGSYQLTDNLLVGGNLSINSGRKFGCFGVHPTDVFAQAYGAASNFCQGLSVPRGTARTSDWIQQFDLSLRYTVPESAIPGDLVLRADIFNVLNLQGETDLNEFGEDSALTPDPNYLKAISYQQPRFVRLGFDLTF
ncbi:TonB-dependent receptor [Brevundimonas sp. SL161]|uniref:TonB-dependent receptor n=1 Tax=Brevundimonas sp. SL161 TaxID=2804613 RepID=UPI003CF68EFA